MYDKSPALFFNMVCGSVVQIFLVLAPVVWDLCLCCLVLVFHMNWPFLKMVCSAVKTPFPFCFAPSLREQIWLISDVNLWLIPFPFPCCLCGCMSFPFFFSVSHNPSLAPFICHFSTNISLWCVPSLFPVPQYLWHPVLSAQGGRFFMWKRAKSSWGGIRSQVLGSSFREVSLLQRPCPLPQSSALLSPTAQLRGNTLRHLMSKQIS